MSYDIQADHPTLARIDKFGLREKEKDLLLADLETYGYENIRCLHRCEAMHEAHKVHRYDHKPKPFNIGHGSAIRKIELDFKEKLWIAHCDEYGDVIDFCPFCGIILTEPKKSVDK